MTKNKKKKDRCKEIYKLAFMITWIKGVSWFNISVRM